MIEGEVFFDRKKDIEMRPLLAKEKKDLIEKERRTPGVAQPTVQQQPVIPTLSEEEIDGHLHRNTPRKIKQ
jgi:hypothetical protein